MGWQMKGTLKRGPHFTIVTSHPSQHRGGRGFPALEEESPHRGLVSFAQHLSSPQPSFPLGHGGNLEIHVPCPPPHTHQALTRMAGGPRSAEHRARDLETAGGSPMWQSGAVLASECDAGGREGRLLTGTERRLGQVQLQGCCHSRADPARSFPDVRFQAGLAHPEPAQELPQSCTRRGFPEWSCPSVSFLQRQIHTGLDERAPASRGCQPRVSTSRSLGGSVTGGFRLPSRLALCYVEAWGSRPRGWHF